MRLFSRLQLFAFSRGSLFTNFLCIVETKMQKRRTRSRFAEQSRSRSHRRPAKVKIRSRSGERMLRSGRNDRVNRGDRPPDRCSANKKAGAFTHASQESQGRSLAVCTSPRGSCRGDDRYSSPRYIVSTVLSLSPSQIRMTVCARCGSE